MDLSTALQPDMTTHHPVWWWLAGLLHGGRHVRTAGAASACHPGTATALFSVLLTVLLPGFSSLVHQGDSACVIEGHGLLQEDFEMAVAKVMKKDSDKNMSLRKLFK